MERTFKEAIKHRRSHYELDEKIAVSDNTIKEIIEVALLNLPSAFNSQTTRIVLLLQENHKNFWEITKKILKNITSEEAFIKTEQKINSAFAFGYGTILFYEDMEIVESLQEKFPTYSDRFPVWAEHTSAIHQFSIWTMLEDAGLGASLQHYNPIIDSEVASKWGINPNWKLVAQMPFGNPISIPKNKEQAELEDRFIIFS